MEIEDNLSLRWSLKVLSLKYPYKDVPRKGDVFFNVCTYITEKIPKKNTWWYQLRRDWWSTLDTFKYDVISTFDFIGGNKVFITRSVPKYVDYQDINSISMIVNGRTVMVRRKGGYRNCMLYPNTQKYGMLNLSHYVRHNLLDPIMVYTIKNTEDEEIFNLYVHMMFEELNIRI